MPIVVTDRHDARVWWCFTAVVAAIVLGSSAVMLHLRFDHSALLWRGVHHDRNGHFLNGLDLALAIRSFDVPAVLSLLERARVWPPVHDLAVAFALLVGGFDHRLAIVPSLLGWGATALLTWVIASRMFVDRIRSAIAGIVAASFTLASPTFRLLGTDVMLECLGAGLTALSLFAYLRCEAAPNQRARWRLLGLVLTILFFEKGNYWSLTAAGLSLAWLSEHWRQVRAGWPRGMATALRSHAGGLLRDPLILGFLAVATLVGAIYAHGPWVIEPFGQRVSLYPPENLSTVAYGLLFLRVVVAWRRHRVRVNAWLGIPGRAILHWHVAPIAVSFLLPKRLSAFLWFLGHSIASDGHDREDGTALMHWTGFAEGFHPAPWAAVLVLLLAAVAVTQLRRLGPAARAVAILGLVSAAGVLIHPNHQWRFQTTWLFTFWILAGIGAAALLGYATAALSARLRALAAIVVILPLVAALGASTPSPMARAAAGQASDGGSDLDLAAAYLPFADGSEPVAFLSSVTRTPFFVWTVHERCRCRVRVDQPWLDQTTSRDDARSLVAAWLAATSIRRIVVIKPLGALRDAALAAERMAGIMDALQVQSRFSSGPTVLVPSYPAEVTFWQMRDQIGAP